MNYKDRVILNLKEENAKLKRDLIEISEALIFQTGQSDNCSICGAWADFNLPICHKKDCTVLKAEKIVSDNE